MPSSGLPAPLPGARGPEAALLGVGPRHIRSQRRIILPPGRERATVGFSQADWQELLRLQGKLDRNAIRLGNRQSRPEPIQLSFLPQPEKPQRPAAKGRRKPPPDPGYERF